MADKQGYGGNEDIWEGYLDKTSIGSLFMMCYYARGGKELAIQDPLPENAKVVTYQVDTFFPEMRDIAKMTYNLLMGGAKKAGKMTQKTQRLVKELGMEAATVIAASVIKDPDNDDIEKKMEKVGEIYLKVRDEFPDKKRTEPITGKEEDELYAAKERANREIADAMKEMVEGGEDDDWGGEDDQDDDWDDDDWDEDDDDDDDWDDDDDDWDDDEEEDEGLSAMEALDDKGYENTKDEELWGDLEKSFKELDLNTLLAGSVKRGRGIKKPETRLRDYFKAINPDVVQYFLYRYEISRKSDPTAIRAQAEKNGLKGKRADKYVAKKTGFAKEEVEKAYDEELLYFFHDMDDVVKKAYKKAKENGYAIPEGADENSFVWVVLFFTDVDKFLPDED